MLIRLRRPRASVAVGCAENLAGCGFVLLVNEESRAKGCSQQTVRVLALQEALDAGGLQQAFGHVGVDGLDVLADGDELVGVVDGF